MTDWVRDLGVAVLAAAAVGAAMLALLCWGGGAYMVWFHRETTSFDSEGMGAFFFVISLVPLVVALLMGAVARSVHRQSA